MTQPDLTQPDLTQPGLTQPGLFDPDDATLDLPVPYRLTGRGRRLVEDLPPLRVVAAAAAPADDRRFVADLAHTDTWRQARVRAMGRAGRAVPDIAADTDLSESVVSLWLAEPDVSPDVDRDGATVGGARRRRTGSGRGTHSAVATTTRDPGAGRDPAAGAADERGRAILATCGTVEVGAATATTRRIAVAEELVAWLRTFHGVPDGGIRVVLRVADRSTADLVARAWADRLDLTPDRVSTVPWSRAPSPRAVQAMVRVTGRELATRLRDALLDWPSPSRANAPGDDGVG